MPAKIPLLDLVDQYHNLQSEIDAAIHKVLESGRFILGPEVEAFENEVAVYLGVRYGIGVASGTDALILSLRALEIGPGDEVIVPAYTFFATVGAVLHVGATPVFVEIDPQTYCLNVAQSAEKITSRTKAIIPVHLYGHPADMDALMDLSHDQGLKVIEDNAQAFGAEYRSQKTASFGDLGCLSFFPSKNLGAYGDAGMVVTSDPELADRVRMLRTHGWKNKYYPEVLGYNSRLDALQAAVLRVKLPYIDRWNAARREVARRYTELLAPQGISTPAELGPIQHAYHQYVIRIPDRNQVRQVLKNAGIGSDVYYPQPPYLADACRTLNYQEGDFPVSDLASRETLALPVFPELVDEDQAAVVDVILSAWKVKQLQ